MKKLVLAGVLFFLAQISFSQTQRIRTVEDLVLIKSSKETESERMKRIDHKKYYTKDFIHALIDNMIEPVSLRYNIYEDQMEFVKSGEVYYLDKVLGAKIRFTLQDKTYVVFNLNGKLNYFNMLSTGKSASLLAKEIVKFIDSKPAKNGYDSDKPADFDRKDDEYYLSLDGENVLEIPRRRKEFYNVFKDNSEKIKIYIKENKLSHKDENDLIRIILYYNSL